MRPGAIKRWTLNHGFFLYVGAVILAGAGYLLYNWSGDDSILKLLAAVLYSGGIVIYVLLLFELLAVLALMWVPLLVTIVAGFMLFRSDQGLDLGVGLLGSLNDNLFKYIALFCTLLFWAFTSWHAARRSLDRRFPYYPVVGHSEKFFLPWLRWPPRFLGICAHLFAALSLSFAAWGHPDDAGNLPDFWGRVAMSGAPIVVIIGCLLFWFFEQNRGVIIKGVAACLLLGAIIFTLFLSRLPPGYVAGSTAIFLSATVYLAILFFEKPPVDFPDFKHQCKFDDYRIFQTVGYCAIGVVGALDLSIWSAYDPLDVGNYIGSMIIAFFAFGALIAFIDVFSLPVDLSYRRARRVVGEESWEELTRAMRDKVGLEKAVSQYMERYHQCDYVKRAEKWKRNTLPALCSCLALISISMSLVFSFNEVRLCNADKCGNSDRINQVADLNHYKGLSSWQNRPTLQEAADAWFDQASANWHAGNSHEKLPVPLVIVASAGGGIRAGFWTATALETLETRLPVELRPYLFAISSVSGGSLGAADYTATFSSEGTKTAQATNFQQADFLAPALVSMIFHDTFSNLYPLLGGPNRGTALEQTFEAASHDLLGGAFLSFFPDISRWGYSGNPVDPAAKSAWIDPKNKLWRPLLLLNATHQKTGRRIIASPVVITRDIFLDSFDTHDLLRSDMRLSTAVLNSARFMYVSPPGKLRPGLHRENLGYVIDGGYFENFGALTALELERYLENRFGDRIKILIVQISSDPSVTLDGQPRMILNQDSSCQISTAKSSDVLAFKKTHFDFETFSFKGDGDGFDVNFLNELLAPLDGVMGTREARGRAASEELAEHICDARNKSPKRNFYYSHLLMCDPGESGEPHIVPPLGWVLSKPSQQHIGEIVTYCGNPTAINELVAEFER